MYLINSLLKDIKIVFSVFYLLMIQMNNILEHVYYTDVDFDLWNKFLEVHFVPQKRCVF